MPGSPRLARFTFLGNTSPRLRKRALSKHDQVDWHYSEPLSVRALGDRICRIIVEGYDDDPDHEDFHAAINNFVSSERDLLGEAGPYVYHVQVGDRLVTRRSAGDNAVYVSHECNCDWEPEHGLQIVFKEGRTVSKVGPYDGQLTNSDAFGDESSSEPAQHALNCWTVTGPHADRGRR